MDDESHRLIYLAMGSLAAIALGIALIPFRNDTSASNFTLPFLVLTILVAEAGGRWAAVATAVTSGLSLDFFLTQPYLRLAIQDKHDIIAFVSLMVCGLVVATLGSKRGERIADLQMARRQQDALHAALVELERGAEIAPSAGRLLDACRSALPLAAIALRDNRNTVIVARPDPRPVPQLILKPDSLLPSSTADRDALPVAVPLAQEGGRIALVVDGRQVGWLDVWGRDAVMRGASRRTLSDLARVLAAMLALDGKESPHSGPS